MTWWGGIAAKSEVDKTLITPGIRIPINDTPKTIDNNPILNNSSNQYTASYRVFQHKTGSDVDKAPGHFSSERRNDPH